MTAIARLLTLPVVLAVAGCAGAAPAPAAPSTAAPSTAAAPPSGPAATAAVRPDRSPIERAFDAVRDDPARLYPFLRAMPKGGDLHSHLGGAVYAESFLLWAGQDGLCVDTLTLTLVEPPCAPAAGRIPAAEAEADEELRNRLVDAFSTRNYRPGVENGHDRFFETFDRMGAGGDGRDGDMIAEVQARAAAGGVSYLELMSTLGGGAPRRLAAGLGWHDDIDAQRAGLLEAGLGDAVEAGRAELADALARRDVVLGCGTPDAAPGCGVEVRFLYQVLRAFPREQVFAMILTGFEMASRDPRVVGLNLVQPEDHRVAMADYSLHMRIIGHLRALYPDVPVTLHAGELWPGLVPPEGLRFHVREAVEVAGARRIGHGVDVLHEDRPYELIEAMAERRVLVEINLTSNDVILGVRGAEHPLDTYLEHGVPVALSTDDEGVSRSEMTLEWMRAVLDQGLDYATLRDMARNSLEYAFVEGASVWADPDRWTPVAACAPAAGGWEAAGCDRFVASSPKARLQRRLERERAAFEAAWAR